MRAFTAVSIAILLATSGCALLTKSDPMTAHYYSPENADQARTPRPPSAPGSAPRELRLGRVTVASYLGERIVFRSSGHEIGFYEDRRWTERPDAYLRRALARTLFEERGFARLVSGAGPTLDVELTELEERTGKPHVARVSATYVLYDARSVRGEATITVETPVPDAPEGGREEAAVRALSETLALAVGQIADRATTDLERASEATAGTATGTAHAE